MTSETAAMMYEIVSPASAGACNTEYLVPKTYSCKKNMSARASSKNAKGNQRKSFDKKVLMNSIYQVRMVNYPTKNALYE